MQRPEPIGPEGMFDGLRWSCIVLGAVLDNVLSMLVGLPVMLWFAGADAFGEDPEAAERAIDRALEDPAFLAASFAVGMAVTAYAAFWAAGRAGTLHVRHGGWTAVASAALAGLFLLFSGGSPGPTPPWWYDALALACMLPAGVAGGWAAARAQGTASGS